MKTYTDINPAYINLIAHIYEESTTCVRTDVGTTESIPLLKGVKQGDISSAIFFCLALMVVLLKTFENNQHGTNIGGITHDSEAYADDIGIITETSIQMNNTLHRLAYEAEELGLKINIKKTKVMFSKKHNPPHLCTINGIKLETVPSFEYLGRILSHDADDTKAVEHRIGNSWGAFQKVKPILTSKHSNMLAKRKTYETYILPCLLYACETITWKEKLFSKMITFQNHIMRWMTGKRLIDKIPITELLSLEKLTPVEKLIKERKLKWFGHIKRSTLHIRNPFEGKIEGKHSRGRPRRR